MDQSQFGQPADSLHFREYETQGFYDELIDDQGNPRPGAEILVRRIEELPDGELLERQRTAERSLFRMGITFNVYGDDQGAEKIFPFDIVPRIIAGAEWERLERGLKQRIRALNLFINDCYHDQQIFHEGIIPGRAAVGLQTHLRTSPLARHVMTQLPPYSAMGTQMRSAHRA